MLFFNLKRYGFTHCSTWCSVLALSYTSVSFPYRAIIKITVENVNTHQPEWFPDPPPNETIELMEEEDISNYVILKVRISKIVELLK